MSPFSKPVPNLTSMLLTRGSFSSGSLHSSSLPVHSSLIGLSARHALPTRSLVGRYSPNGRYGMSPGLASSLRFDVGGEDEGERRGGHLTSYPTFLTYVQPAPYIASSFATLVFQQACVLHG